MAARKTVSATPKQVASRVKPAAKKTAAPAAPPKPKATPIKAAKPPAPAKPAKTTTAVKSAKPAPKSKSKSKAAKTLPLSKAAIAANLAVAKARLDSQRAAAKTAAQVAATRAESQAVYAALRDLLLRHGSRLKLVSDGPGEICLQAGYAPEWKKTLFFGAVATRKSYISYYLFPVYVFPEMLKTISPRLKARMQGKSCFNFQRVEPALFEELGQLTARGFERFSRAGWLR